MPGLRADTLVDKSKGDSGAGGRVLHQADEFRGAELIEGFLRMAHSVRAIPAVLCRNFDRRAFAPYPASRRAKT